MRLANEALNHTPNMQDKNKRSPMQLFTSTPITTNIHHHQPFGSPVYTLESAMQNQQPCRKWKHRVQRGVYLGPSPSHARNVALVLNPHTGLVSPQYHVAYDPTFQTVRDDQNTCTWDMRAGLSPINPPDKRHPNQKSHKPNSLTQTNKRKEPHTRVKDDTSSSKRRKNTPKPPEINATQKSHGYNVNKSLRQSKRINLPVQRLMHACTSEMITSDDITAEILALENIYPDYKTKLEENPLLAFKATADPDTLCYHEAMRQPDRREFITAMEKEVNDNLKKETFKILHRSQVPEGATVLRSMWQLRRKRHMSTQEIKKWKARLNVDGSQMIRGLHYDQTCAPVAKWSLIRLILILSLIKKWTTRQLDYNLAHTQAPIERNLCIKIPPGYTIENGDPKDYVLQLKRNLHGQKQAGRAWYLHLRKTSLQLGFSQSRHDECLFYRNKVTYVVYTDDTIITAPTNKKIEVAIQDMRNAGLHITDEGTINYFLGVNIKHHNDTTIELTQPHLIDSILKDLRLTAKDTKPKDMPAASTHILRRHSDSQPFDKSFNYKSVIGKLGYLEKGSRPEIAYITHQCARFTSDPKTEHGKAARWLGRYLHATKNKGTILNIDAKKGLEVHVDADYAGNWDPLDTSNPDTARSRHGYITSHAGCPMLSKSQLQTEITLSRTESEYTGLSYALREVTPIMHTLTEISKVIDLPTATPQLKCTVFEENSGALKIATNHKYRPRTKHLDNRLHHFRSCVADKTIEITKISTNDQIADILTKPMNEEKFKRLSRQFIGW